MATIESQNPRSNNGTGTQEVGTCFIVSNRYPQFSFMISLVDLPEPSAGYEYQFAENYENGWLTYNFVSDPNQPANAATKTYIMPAYAITEDDISNNLVQNVSVNDTSSRIQPKNGTVSTIKLVGNWIKPDATPAPPSNPEAWWVNAFIIQSSTQTSQYFLVSTCDIMPSLDGYNGPYTNVLILTPDTSIYGGNLQVTPTRPTGPELGETEITAIYTGEITAPLNLSFFTVGVWAQRSSSNISQNYTTPPSTDTPDASI